MTHVMLDLETYGVAPGCPVLAIGAVVFSHQDRTLPAYTFYEVAKADQGQYGLQPEADTVKWWSEQSEEARKVLTDYRAIDLPVMLDAFAAWLPKDAYVWGNGADFDLPILAAAYRACGGKNPPWKPYNGRCYRTIKNLRPDISISRVGTHHNALDDAVSQAAHLAIIAAALGLDLG